MEQNPSWEPGSRSAGTTDGYSFTSFLLTSRPYRGLQDGPYFVNTKRERLQ